MRTIGIAALLGIAGYLIGIGVGIGLVALFSSNQHDRSMEAGMTGFFVSGPLCAVLAVLIYLGVRLLR